MSENKNMDLPLIEVKNLKQHFPITVGPFKTKPLKAVTAFPSASSAAKLWVW